MSAKHTPTPWALQGKRYKKFAIWQEIEPGSTAGLLALVPDIFPESKSNAEFIVRAVNSHEALLEAAKNVVDAYHMNEDAKREVRKLEIAIAQAEGKS